MHRIPRIILGWQSSALPTEEDFTDWVRYVCTHIDEACGFEVDVDFNEQLEDDRVRNADDAERATIVEAIERLWEQGCADNFGLPSTEVL